MTERFFFLAIVYGNYCGLISVTTICRIAILKKE